MKKAKGRTAKKTGRKTVRARRPTDPEAKEAPEIRRILHSEEDGMILENVFEQDPEKG